jgi:heat shock protein HslJ
LEIIEGNMKIRLIIISMLIIAVIIATGACSSPQGTSGLENKTWKLESYGQEASLNVVLSGTEITVTFEGGKDQVSGSSGVNTYSGSYRLNSNKLSILELAWTEMARLDPPGVMEQEAEYLKLFKAAESFIIDNNKLKITSGDQVLIYYDTNSGIFQGRVSIGPITPVERPGEITQIPPEVYESRKIMVYDKSGNELIQQVDIDSESGWYVTHLKPGTYTIDINRIGMDSSDDVPQQVEIQLDITTRLDIDIDTGIR